MKKCIVISDSFKGSLPSRDICAIARERIPLFFPACEVRALNVADGGEGTVDCFLASCGGERVLVSGVQNPYGEPIDEMCIRDSIIMAPPPFQNLVNNSFRFVIFSIPKNDVVVKKLLRNNM